MSGLCQKLGVLSWMRNRPFLQWNKPQWQSEINARIRCLQNAMGVQKSWGSLGAFWNVFGIFKWKHSFGSWIYSQRLKQTIWLMITVQPFVCVVVWVLSLKKVMRVYWKWGQSSGEHWHLEEKPKRKMDRDRGKAGKRSNRNGRRGHTKKCPVLLSILKYRFNSERTLSGSFNNLGTLLEESHQNWGKCKHFSGFIKKILQTLHLNSTPWHRLANSYSNNHSGLILTLWVLFPHSNEGSMTKLWETRRECEGNWPFQQLSGASFLLVGDWDRIPGI